MTPARRLPLILAGGAALFLTAAAEPPPDRMVALADGRRMHLICKGHGAPTVLFEGGWAATATSWAKIQDRVAVETTACAYDRAGTGTSEPGPLPRSAGAIADDLEDLLRASNGESPYVIVAHSLGALPARIVAARPGSQVAGLLLVDPSVEYQPQRMGGSANAFNGMATRARNEGRLQQAAELEVLAGLSSDEVAQAGPVPAATEVVVLTAGRSQPQPEAQARWEALHEAIGGTHRVVAEAGHMIPRDRPELVADETLALVSRIRAR